MAMAISPTEAAVLDALRAVKDPDLHKDIVALGFVKNLRIDGGARRVHDRADDAGVSGQGPDARPGARGRVGAAGVSDVDIEMTAQVRAAARPDGGPRAGRRREEHHRGRRRQGRRRQDDRRREPGGRARAARQPRRAARRRHVRAEHSDHARPAHAARDRRQEDRAGRALRPPGRLDGIPDAGRRAGHLARSDAARRDSAVLPRRRAGRTSTTSSWTCRRAPATSR